MKQLATLVLSPVSDNHLLSRIKQFSAQKILLFLTLPQRLVGKWRLYLNYCPECNSCAPKIHHCDVCNADTKSYFSWSKEVKQNWWTKYAKKHHIAV